MTGHKLSEREGIVICKHLKRDPLLEAHPIEVEKKDGTKEWQGDYVCKACFDANERNELNTDDMLVICPYCFSKARLKAVMGLRGPSGG